MKEITKVVVVVVVVLAVGVCDVENLKSNRRNFLEGALPRSFFPLSSSRGFFNCTHYF